MKNKYSNMKHVSGFDTQVLNEFYLKYVRMAMETKFSKEVLLSSVIYVTDYMDEMILRFSLDVPAEEVHKQVRKVMYSYPGTWWEMFKFQYAPEWFRVWFPVKWHTITKNVTFTVDALYPKLPIARPDMQNQKIHFRPNVTIEGPSMLGGDDE